MAVGARKALVRGVPVEAGAHQLALVDGDWLTARLAAVGKQVLEAAAAEGSRVAHDVPLTAELETAVRAGEVTHVPAATLRFRAFVAEDYLTIIYV